MAKEVGKSWLWARDQMRRARDPNYGKPVSGNTLLRISRVSPTDEWDSDDVVYALQYHRTEIVRYYPDGLISASLGGWDTVTTKQRVREYSPVSISGFRGSIYAVVPGVDSSGLNQRWLGSPETWFFWRSGLLIFQGGGQIPDLRSTRIKLKVPKGRDTVSNPREGDAFQEGERHWVVAIPVGSTAEKRLQLYPYYGDHPEDRSLFVTDKDAVTRDLLSPMEHLALTGAEGLKPVNRFVWQEPSLGA